MKSFVTTKRGDAGMTTALSGDDYPKSHPIMECVGTVDELRAHTALLRLRILEEKPPGYHRCGDFLLWLLHAYFLVGSACSDPLNKKPQYHRGAIGPEHLNKLEAEQARLEEHLTLPNSFIVSARTTIGAQADIVATVSRRLERNVSRLLELTPEFQHKGLIPFLNRLSDYLYILARHLDGPRHLPVDYALLSK